MIYILILLIILFVIMGCFLFIGNHFYNFAIKRGKKSFLKKDFEVKDLRFNEESLWFEDIEKQQVFINTKDRLKLSAYYINQNSPKTAVIVHGYSGRGKDMTNLARLFFEWNFNVLLPDLRGHGNSEGNYISFSYHDKTDLLKWLDYLINLSGDNIEIVIIGISMGGATVCAVSGENLPQNVKFIVSDSAFDNVKAELAYQLKRMYKLPAFPIINFTSLICKIRAGYFLGEAKIKQSVQESKIPMIFIHGENDKFVPTEMVYNLYNVKNGDKELLIIKNARHAESYTVAKEKYIKVIQKYINKYLTS